jgi:hypothetical protein
MRRCAFRFAIERTSLTTNRRSTQQRVKAHARPAVHKLRICEQTQQPRRSRPAPFSRVLKNPAESHIGYWQAFNTLRKNWLPS